MTIRSFAKPSRGTAKRERRARTAARNQAERTAKAAVRRRDKRCRFPLCGCWRDRGARLEVAHAQHKGMGGNPAGDRSRPELMVWLCAWRHKESRRSIDRGTLRWEAVSEAGANGAIAWSISTDHMPGGWIEIARESAPGVILPCTPAQLQCLTTLARMET